jgi:hypothetical protein
VIPAFTLVDGTVDRVRRTHVPGNICQRLRRPVYLELLLDVVPVADEEERQIVLKAINYFEDGTTPVDSFYAATVEARGLPSLSSDKAHDDVDPDRYPLEMHGEEDGG